MNRAVPPSSMANKLAMLIERDTFVSTAIIGDVHEVTLWHCRLGHISYSRLKLIDDHTVKDNGIHGNDIPIF